MSSLFILFFSGTCSPALLVTVHLTHGNLKAIYPKLAEQFSVSVPFTQLEDEVECEAQQENVIDRNMELCLKLTETPMEELVDEKEQHLCACEERQSKVTVNHCPNQHVEQERECSEETPLLVGSRVHPPASSTGKGKKRPPGVVSAVSVAQLVIEEDSLLSEVESSDSQQDPSQLQVCSNSEDLLSSQSTSSTPVRKYRRPAPRR